MNKLGKYELHETVGAGAMSTVYRGVDPASGETVAVKALHAHMASAANIARFEREVHALSGSAVSPAGRGTSTIRSWSSWRGRTSASS
jgi:serine/threonine protein kinase